MNYIMSEEQFNAVSHVQAQLRLLIELSTHVNTKEMRISTNSFVVTINALEEKLDETLQLISNTK